MSDSLEWKGGAIDVTIVGAGAAGIGAARRLQALRPDLSVLVLEAGDRVGGRAWTIRPPLLEGNPVDLGCGWLHGARTNAWTGIAEEIGLTVEKTPAPWSEGGRNLEAKIQAEQDARAAINEFFLRAEKHSDQHPDGALADLLEPGNPFNGRLGAIGTYLNGAELDQASIKDYSNYDPGPGPDWRIREGYGTLVATYAQPVPVKLGAIVTRVDHRAADHIVVETTMGTIETRAVVISVSTNVLASEHIRFDPPFPEKIKAAGELPLGLANKLFLRTSLPEEFPLDTHLIGSRNLSATGSYQIRPFGRPVIEAYFGGPLAHDLEKAGQAAALSFASEELAHHFGNEVTAKLDVAAMSAWAGTRHIGGSYSYARPGASPQRSVLAAPVDDRLFFAGEACSLSRFSTAHGAYETGAAAAERIAISIPGR
ncbi:flavin monoamine oxidase family protein [Rhizobium tubonense]|uniref:Tryptophan 2-monooxygenase n=1 Tax=Rhizobium tubonense TaxID=484088 RepID=A0A2W4CV23_9HYPH|nr:NAD(P)/FAD-dependent oxidoreductase [Rhizobium tubonense]PZM16212.1 monoamine oxidase [Rhizobium tubonense]